MNRHRLITTFCVLHLVVFAILTAMFYWNVRGELTQSAHAVEQVRTLMAKATKDLTWMTTGLMSRYDQLNTIQRALTRQHEDTRETCLAVRADSTKERHAFELTQQLFAQRLDGLLAVTNPSAKASLETMRLLESLQERLQRQEIRWKVRERREDLERRINSR